ncbi:hypothetical protein PVK06_006331 [Gossypium arboreum]|uniref:Uncharacterized protein n=1 Tax=Gossypium arboreum TaxID=29729 RepID=A0ABR0QEF1_GOSAR|nr:hypothetical protein PVK06_006331 [Gossypium arboreum]
MHKTSGILLLHCLEKVKSFLFTLSHSVLLHCNDALIQTQVATLKNLVNQMGQLATELRNCRQAAPEIEENISLFSVSIDIVSDVVYPKIFADYQLFSRGLLQSFEFQYQIRAPVVAWRSFKTFSATEKVLEWKSGTIIVPQILFRPDYFISLMLAACRCAFLLRRGTLKSLGNTAKLVAKQEGLEDGFRIVINDGPKRMSICVSHSCPPPWRAPNELAFRLNKEVIVDIGTS